jgi:hypothetical protein
MVAGPLVDRLIDRGEQFIRMLDEAGVCPRAALWVRRLESDDWNLVVATETASRDGPKAAYTELLGVFRAHEEGLAPLRATDLVVVEPTDSLIRQHLAVFKTRQGISQIWSSGNAINGQLLPDALVYRLLPSNDRA